MEVISTNQIVDPDAQQPITGPSLTFLQNALRKDDAGIIEALVKEIVGSYSLTVPYVISGCVVSDTNKDVTAGTLFYGGKFYETTAVNGATNVARFILTKTQDATADPVTFTDGSSKNVHDIYKYVATDVASGGDFIATDLIRLDAAPATKLNFCNHSVNQNSASTPFVDLTGSTYTTPNDGVTRTYLIQGKSNAEFTGSAGDGGELRILVDGVQKDLGRTYVDVTAATVGSFTGGMSCLSIQSVLPNKIIKLQISSPTGAGIDFKNNSFIVVEL